MRAVAPAKKDLLAPKPFLPEAKLNPFAANSHLQSEESWSHRLLAFRERMAGAMLLLQSIWGAPKNWEQRMLVLKRGKVFSNGAVENTFFHIGKNLAGQCFYPFVFPLRAEAAQVALELQKLRWNMTQPMRLGFIAFRVQI